MNMTTQMENSSIILTTAGRPPAPHDLTQLPESLALISSSPETDVLLLISSDIPTTQPAALAQLVVPIAENEHDHSISTIEFKSPDRQNEQSVMMTPLSIQHSAHDSSILPERGEIIASAST
uniref:uncharacterized protein LOC122580256 n=1 Tax=Erigeron canadensis TaxID=72917 RepID=UPI001CB8E592|nr:uncharacterized protein LOC122580256 [Erigeron canadensis]